MTIEKFDKITERCQPHKVFNSDWEHFYSRDFADTLLPNVGLIKGKAIEFYDGAELLPLNNNFPRRFLQLTPDGKLISLTLFSYPKGVKTEKQKLTVQPEKFELCIFFEIDINDKINIYLKSGDNFKTALRSIAKAQKATDLSSSIDTKNFTTTLNDFQTFFKDEYSHYQVLAYVGKLIGIDLEGQHNRTAFKVHIDSIKAYTSEPSNNHKRKIKEKKTKYIKVDFEIINQPADSYSLYVYKDGKELYQMYYLPEVTVFSNPTNTTTKSDDFPIGKYSVEWYCTDNKIFDTKNETDKITFKIQATNQYKEIAVSQTELNIKQLIAKVEKNNFIIILDEKDKEIKVFGNEIIDRQEKFVSQIPEKVFMQLSAEGKLILNLPVIMAKLNLLHGALCQIHWLEGSKNSLKFPYEFFMSEKRVENIDIENLKEYFKELEYLSIENLGYSPSNPDGVNKFLYNDSLGSIKESLILFNTNLGNRTENGSVGGDEKFIDEITLWDKIKNDPKKKAEYTNENYFQSFPIGSALGDIDDIGTALGRYSQRCYFAGFLSKNTQTNKWILDIDKVKCRFSDDFSFDDKSDWYNPFTWGSQNLGYWKNDIENPELPVRTVYETAFKSETWLLLENITYRELKKTLHKSINNSCNDFFIYSDIKTIDDEFLQKSILIH